MNEEIMEILESYKAALNQIADRQNEIESLLYDEILTPAKEAYDKAQDDAAFADYSKKYGEKLSPFNEQLKVIEGDENFDLTRRAYDDFKGTENIDEAEYVDALVEKVTKQLETLKSALGIPSDAEVEVKETPDGEVEVKADGEVVATEETVEAEPTETENADTEVETEVEADNGETEVEAEKGETETDADAEVEDDPEEVKALEKELEGYLKK